MSFRLAPDQSRECQVGQCEDCPEEHRNECTCPSGFHDDEALAHALAGWGDDEYDADSAFMEPPC